MKRVRQRKTPEWREFEKLVERIERILVPEGAVIRSPDRLPHLRTGRMREVDATIRMKVGSADITIGIECRRRRAKQDSIWIEQLKTKREVLGLAQIIVVSKSDFTKDVVEAAPHCGVVLRQLKAVTDEEIAAWRVRCLIHVYKYISVVGSPIVEYHSRGVIPMVCAVNEKIGMRDRVFHLSFQLPYFSLEEIFVKVQEQRDVYAGVPDDGSVVGVRVVVLSSEVEEGEEDGAMVDGRRLIVVEPGGGTKLRIKTQRGLASVRRLSVDMDLSWRREDIPLSKAVAMRYEGATVGDLPVYYTEFETKAAAANNIRLSIQMKPGTDEARVMLEVLGQSCSSPIEGAGRLGCAESGPIA